MGQSSGVFPALYSLALAKCLIRIPCSGIKVLVNCDACQLFKQRGSLLVFGDSALCGKDPVVVKSRGQHGVGSNWTVCPPLRCLRLPCEEWMISHDVRDLAFRVC